MHKGIAGIGVDLCAIDRIEQAMKKPHFMERIFTAQERAYIEAKGAAAAQSAAAIFAAKEAVAKALGCGFAQGVMPGQIEVTHAQSGEPGIRLEGAAAALGTQRGAQRIHISLSHEGNMAIAFAVMEAKEAQSKE